MQCLTPPSHTLYIYPKKVPQSPCTESEVSITASLAGSQDHLGLEESDNDHLTTGTASSSSKAQTAQTFIKKRRKMKSDEDEMMKIARARARLVNPEPTSNEDEFDVFGGKYRPQAQKSDS